MFLEKKYRAEYPEVFRLYGDRIEVDDITGCWYWTGARCVTLRRKSSVPFRRAILTIIETAIPSGKVAFAGCGETMCGNPEHAIFVKSGTWRSPKIASLDVTLACLRCDAKFKSKNKASNRLCATCRHTNSGSGLPRGWERV